MDTQKLIREIEKQRDLMVAVSTGGPRIQEINEEYIERRYAIRSELKNREIDDPNPHGDLWAWYGRWSAGDLSTWASRRTYLAEMFQPLIDKLVEGPPSVGAQIFEEPIGWEKIDRGIYEVRRQLELAKIEEQFQAIGLLCRELLISLGQTVYKSEIHKTVDDVEPSSSDAMRMLDAYISKELTGSSNEAIRRYARAALTLANDLQHRRTATYISAALCAQATFSTINLVAVISGKRGGEGSNTNPSLD